MADKKEEKIKFKITVHQGRDMPSCDSNGFSDPFVVMSWFYVKGPKKISLFEKKSTVKPKTLNPVWNDEVFEFEFLNWKQFSGSSLEIVVWDKDLIIHDFMGRLEPMLMEGIDKKPFPFAEKQWFKLIQDEKKKYQTSGDLCISYSYSGVTPLLEYKTMKSFIDNNDVESAKLCLLNGYKNPTVEILDDLYRTKQYPVWYQCISKGNDASLELLKFYCEHGGSISPNITFLRGSPGKHLIDSIGYGNYENFIDYFIEMDAIVSDDLIFIRFKPNSSFQHLWRKLVEKGIEITDKVWEELMKENDKSQHLLWIMENLQVQPPSVAFNYAISHRNFDVAKVIASKLDSIEITVDMIINANSDEMRQFLIENHSGPISISGKDLFKLNSSYLDILNNSIQNGADVNVTDDNGKLLLESYMEIGWYEGCEAIINCEKLNIPEDKYSTLVKIAIKAPEHQMKMLQLLHTANVNLDVFNSADMDTLKSIVKNEELFKYIFENTFKNYNKETQEENLKSLIKVAFTDSGFIIFPILSSIDNELVKDTILEIRNSHSSVNRFYHVCSVFNINFVNEIIPATLDVILKNPPEMDTESAILKIIKDGKLEECSVGLYSNPLLTACYEKSWNLAKIFIDNDISPYSKGSSVFNYIQKQKTKGELDNETANTILEPLLKKQADAKEHTENIIKLLIEAKDNDSKFTEAKEEIAKNLLLSGEARYQDKDIVNLLVDLLPNNDESGTLMKKVIDLNADPSVIGDGGRTPLLTAALKGNLSLVKELLNVSDSRATDKERSNIFHMVAVNGNIDVFNYLDSVLHYNSFDGPSSKNNLGQTPGQLCRQLFQRGKIGHIELDSKMNSFFGSGPVY